MDVLPDRSGDRVTLRVRGKEGTVADVEQVIESIRPWYEDSSVEEIDLELGEEWRSWPVAQGALHALALLASSYGKHLAVREP